MSDPTEHIDQVLDAVRRALETAGHKLDELIVTRNDPADVIVRYNPHDDDWRDETSRTTAYAQTLRAAGWPHTRSLGTLCLIPDVPEPGTHPDTILVTWAYSHQGNDDQLPPDDNAQLAVEEARECQRDPQITTTGWGLTDSVGRRRFVTHVH